jgi:hypothetical protein
MAADLAEDEITAWLSQASKHQSPYQPDLIASAASFDIR